jgi:AraC family transcriptional activator of pobA
MRNQIVAQVSGFNFFIESFSAPGGVVHVDLIFIPLRMPKVIALQSFYKAINQTPKAVSQEAGHFNIFRIEDILSPANKSSAYSRRDFFKISLITGHNKLHYADQTIEIHDTALVFTNPLIPYFWERLSERQTGHLCIFTEAFFSRFANIREYPVFQSVDSAIIPLKAREIPVFRVLFDKMHREIAGDYLYKYDLLRTLLMEVVHEAQKLQPASGQPLTGSNASERIAGLFNDLLERQFPIELSNQIIQLSTPTDFARQMNIHVNHLNKALKEVTDQTTSQLIAKRIVREARILLKSTTWTIGEIAFSLGFEESNHFSSFFKTRTRLTPKQFRQSKD